MIRGTNSRNYALRYTSMIESSMMINDRMPEYCVERAAKLLSHCHKSMNGAKILMLGVAYKKDIDDCRESPALEVMEILEEQGADVQYYDPWVPEIKKDGKVMNGLANLSEYIVKDADLVIITTAHTGIDYDMVQKNAKIIFDTKNAMKNIKSRENIEVL